MSDTPDNPDTNSETDVPVEAAAADAPAGVAADGAGTDIQPAPDGGEEFFDGTAGTEPKDGEPASEHPDATPAPKVWVVAGTSMTVVSLTSSGFAPQDTPDGAVAAVISTRIPRGEITALVGESAAKFDGPIIALAHPGGEAGAVEAIRAGAAAIVAEGDRAAILSIINGTPRDAHALVDAFDVSIGRGAPTRVGASSTSSTTGLPSSVSLATRLATWADPERKLRVISFRVIHFAQATARMGPEAVSMLHRRLASAFGAVCADQGELFDLGEGAFVLLSPGMSIVEADRLGMQLADVASAYMPDAHSGLQVAVGHAGPETGSDPASLRELAGRAEAAAAMEESSAVLGAGELVGPLATATELDALLKLVELVERRDTAAPARSAVAQVATDLAGRLGFEGHERSLVRFVAQMSEVGKATLAADAYEPGTEAWKQHPLAGAALLGPVAGEAAADAIRAHHERFDGTGFPEGLAGTAIPFAARIVAVADAYIAADQDLDAIVTDAGTAFDPAVIESIVEMHNEQNNDLA